MFDCVMPTRNGRNGMLFTSEGVINIRNKKWTSLQVTKAFCKTAAISQQLVGALDRLVSMVDIFFVNSVTSWSSLSV